MNKLFLAIYCCVYTIEWHHLDSTLRRGARGSSLFWWDFSCSDLGLSRSNPRAACFLFKMYGCVNVCVCTYSPTCVGSLFLFSFCFQLFPRLWFHLLSATCVALHPRFFCSNPEFGISAHQISLCSTPTHTPFWSKCKRHYWFPSARGLEYVQSLKESSLRSCPSFDDCHLKVVFASSTISFNFFVLSVLNGGDAQNVNSSSDSKSNSKAYLASLKKVLWSCHKHPLGVTLNSVSGAPFSKSQTFCLPFRLTSAFSYVLVLKDNVIDLETVCGNSPQNSASAEDWCWDTCW